MKVADRQTDGTKEAFGNGGCGAVGGPAAPDPRQELIAVGARILVRDAEWRVNAVEPVVEGGWCLKCTGLSELVRGRQVEFLTLYETGVRVLRPEESRLVLDTSPGFALSRLYIESLIRTAPLTDDSKICVAHHAAMDPMPYQFDPCLQALKQPRARILIADAVGIGKTLEAGILVSELIARGRGKRILVLATKSVLPQFQKEFWNRFSIALTRLDSQGIQRVRNRIPSNHNPFHYFDRSIISIDTLKQTGNGYLEYLRNAKWDIILIDEAHNVADRGNASLRAKLAKILADRSDTMILLSATPHDGRPESFASLLNILDPLAIANPEKYTPADFADKGLVIRRFKHNIRDQVASEFKDRTTRCMQVQGTAAEEAVFDYLALLTFDKLDGRGNRTTGARLFATTLIKAVFSSPAACASVVKHRIAKLSKEKDDDSARRDIAKLKELAGLLAGIGDGQFAKLDELVRQLKSPHEGIRWTRAADDRLVIFTESVETLDYLAAVLPGKIGLGKKEFARMDGGQKDTEIEDIVEKFNNGESPLRLLLCSDVASEGINLHHFAHRMIHFDIPWSLMVFQQRNGRIDRYGQEKQPQIYYLQTTSKNPTVLGDARILAKLQEKDDMAQKNLADPAEFTLTQQQQEDRTADEMEGREVEPVTPENDPIAAFFAGCGSVADAPAQEDAIASWFAGEPAAAAAGPAAAKPQTPPSAPIAHVLTHADYNRSVTQRGLLFDSDMAFGTTALGLLSGRGYDNWPAGMYTRVNDHEFLLQPPQDLLARLRYLPREVLPESGRFDLVDDTKVVQQEMRHVMLTGENWPAKTLFWSLHPVMQWLEERMQTVFGRHSAPVVAVRTVPAGEMWALLQGGYPNRRGYIPVHRWVAVRSKDGHLTTHTLQELVAAVGIGRELPNTNAGGTAPEDLACRFRTFVGGAVGLAAEVLAGAKKAFEEKTLPKLQAQIAALDELKGKHMQQLELDFGGGDARKRTRRQEKQAQIERHFAGAVEYVEETATLEDKPYLQLVAIFCPVNRED